MSFDGYKEAQYLDSKISLLLEKHPPEYGEHSREWLRLCRLPDVESCKSHGIWFEGSAESDNHRELLSLLTDTKTLLKEAKEVKDGDK